jgi:hypothetical protein
MMVVRCIEDNFTHTHTHIHGAQSQSYCAIIIKHLDKFSK